VRTRSLALQRTIGNAATRTALARKRKPEEPRKDAPPAPKPAQPTFRVWIVEDGSTGLEQKTLDVAIASVREELAKVASASGNAVVKGGFDVQYRRTAPEWHKDLGVKELDVTTWIVFLLKKNDTKQAVEHAMRYLDLDARKKADYETTAKTHFASEGGYNLQQQGSRPDKPSQSVSFATVDVAAQWQKRKDFGPDSAGRILGEVILHELGHAMGHVHRKGEDESHKDHDRAGIMEESLTIGSAGPYVPRRFSTESARVIRARLEWLVGKIPTPKPKAP
jgi:hypothetical protein